MLGLLGVATYVTYTLNLWGPMIRMANAASQQALEVAKERLRDFLENSEVGRQANAQRKARKEGRYAANGGLHGAAADGDDEDMDDYDDIPMDKLDGDGRRRRLQRSSQRSPDDDDDDDA